MKKKHVWVIELLDFTYPEKGWSPCAACGIDRQQARLIQKQWKERNPDDRFRITKYVSDHLRQKPHKH